MAGIADGHSRNRLGDGVIRLIALLAALVLAPGCASVCSHLSGEAKRLCESLNKPDPPPVVAYVVTEGQRVEQVARSVAFDITPARDGTPELEDVPVWAYAGTDPATWNGGNHTGLLAVRVKCNDAGSYELKVGPTPAGVLEPDVRAPCKAGVKVSMKLELTDDGVRFTAGGDSKFVAVPISGDHTIGYGWPPQKRQGCLGAKIENVVVTP